jgi:putative tryptophan/tyrosine transport system substrate-binding protein
MLRRNFIRTVGGAVFGWPWIATAQQQTNRVWRIAHVYPGKYDNASAFATYDVFRGRLRELGYIEGKNLVIDQRAAEEQLERLPLILSDLIALRPDVIVAILNSAIAAAQRATSIIPIIMAPGINPIGVGFVRSLARPGGNITGISSMSDDIMGKTAELLHAMLPSAERIAVLLSNNPTHPWQYELAEVAIKNLGLAAVRVVAPKPDDLEQAFEIMRNENCDALFVPGDVTRPAIVTLAAKAKIPAFYASGAYVPLGGLASYSPQLAGFYRTAAQYCDRIFKGANPAELPVEQPVVFELAINLKAAASLGLAIPDSVMARADRVIE